MSLCRACKCCSEKSPKCPYVSQNFPVCSLRVACSETSLRRSAESRVCASCLLDVRCRLKKVLASSLIQSTQCAQCASGVGSSRSASSFGLAFSDEVSPACKKVHSLCRPSGDSLQSLAGPICLQTVSAPLFPEAAVCSASSGELACGLVVNPSA